MKFGYKPEWRLQGAKRYWGGSWLTQQSGKEKKKINFPFHSIIVLSTLLPETIEQHIGSIYILPQGLCIFSIFKHHIEQLELLPQLFWKTE